MPSSQLRLRATKAPGYFDSLCKHFARKVSVTQEAGHAHVLFPMGQCNMSVDGQLMRFSCSADDESALDAVKTIISTHVVRFGELKDAQVDWVDE